MFAALLLMAALQTAPAPADPAAGEEIVVRATLGRTTMLFDKGADGKLRNCRIMISSGSDRRDTAACQATPICYAKTADEVDCRNLTILDEAAALAGPGPSKSASDKAPLTFTLPKLVQPAPTLTAGQAGPLGVAEESKDTERQRVKLPPLPKSPTAEPAIRITGGTQQQQQSDGSLIP